MTPDTLSLPTLAIRYRPRSSAPNGEWVHCATFSTQDSGFWEVEPLVSGPEAAARIRDLEQALEAARAYMHFANALADRAISITVHWQGRFRSFPPIAVPRTA